MCTNSKGLLGKGQRKITEPAVNQALRSQEELGHFNLLLLDGTMGSWHQMYECFIFALKLSLTCTLISRYTSPTRSFQRRIQLHFTDPLELAVACGLCLYCAHVLTPKGTVTSQRPHIKTFSFILGNGLQCRKYNLYSSRILWYSSISRAFPSSCTTKGYWPLPVSMSLM